MSNSPVNVDIPMGEGPVAALCAVLGDLGVKGNISLQRTGTVGIDRSLALVPNARSPRIALPADSPRAARAAVQRYSADLDWKQRVGRYTAAGLLGLRGPRAPLASHRIIVEQGLDQGLIAYLSELFGQRICFSLSIGNERVNRKPILEIFSATGHSLGFAKVGTNPVTSALVAAEARTLLLLGSNPWQVVRIPEVIFSGTYNGLTLLVMTSLPTSAYISRKAFASLRQQGQLEVQNAFREEPGPLGDSRWFTSLESAVASGPLESALSTQLRNALAGIRSRYADTHLEYGALHGDWTAWNMAVHRNKLQVWDWERFTRGVPLGSDRFHYDLHRNLRAEGLGTGTVLKTITRADTEPAAALAYLASLAARYVQGTQILAVPSLERKTRALIESIECTLGE